MGQETARAETGAIIDVSAAAGAPLISVVIPHYNDLDNLRLCLSLLQKQKVTKLRRGRHFTGCGALNSSWTR